MAGTRPAVVSMAHSKIVGAFYFKTDTHVVLLNNIVERADLGSLSVRRDRHFEPEADVIVLPIDADTTIDFVD